MLLFPCISKSYKLCLYIVCVCGCVLGSVFLVCLLFLFCISPTEQISNIILNLVGARFVVVYVDNCILFPFNVWACACVCVGDVSA